MAVAAGTGFSELILRCDPLFDETKASLLVSLFEGMPDVRLWDDWSWIEHSPEAHAALKYFETQKRQRKVTIHWVEDTHFPLSRAGRAHRRWRRGR